MRKNITSPTGLMAAAAASLTTLSITLAMASSSTVNSPRGDGLRPAVVAAAAARVALPYETNWG